MSRTFERADSSGLQRPHITATVLPELKEQLPNMKMPQHVSMVFRRGDFVPPHEMTQDDSMGKSLPADSAFLSSSLAMPFRPVSIPEALLKSCYNLCDFLTTERTSRVVVLFALDCASY